MISVEFDKYENVLSILYVPIRMLIFRKNERISISDNKRCPNCVSI